MLPQRGAARSSSSLARRLLIAFGATTLLAMSVCATLLVLVRELAENVDAVRRDERLALDALRLGVAVREQYIHEAHTIIEGDRSHLGHHGDWVARVRRDTRRLASAVPPGERWRLDRTAETSAALVRLFEIDIVPAVERGDRNAVRSAHRTVDALVARTAGDTDAVAAALETRMAEAQSRSAQLTRVAFGATGLSMLVLVGVGFVIVAGLRRDVLQPLGALAAAARRMGEGDLTTRVDVAAKGEIRALSDAFNRMAEELRAREERLLASERLAAIGQLAAGLAHEVNNPIGIIRGYLRTMIPEARDDEQRNELEILDEEARSCQRLVEDLLAFARARELDVDPVAIAALLSETARRLESSGELGSTRVHTRVDDVVVAADEGRLRQVVSNLVRNAAQVSPPGEPVELTGEAREHDYVVTVADRGPGIAQDDRARVFEPFWSKRPGGTGLGLAVCAGIVRAHGGRIEARPRDGGGTEMVVTLPRETP
ncbi:MAG: HAMP domain-containing histidine kinase [Deltaproteobacteria bacterium]|nr:HAMP domain-containing histidine kinase [Deltaproteobacteria bacterium]